MKVTLVFTLFLVLMGAMLTSARSGAGCICPLNFDPVCGKNGVTYGNSCQAACAGVKVARKGDCKSGRS